MLVQHLQPMLEMEDDAWSAGLNPDFDAPTALSLDLVSEVLSGALELSPREWDILAPIADDDFSSPSADEAILGKRKRGHGGSAGGHEAVHRSKRQCAAFDTDGDEGCALAHTSLSTAPVLGLYPLALETDIEEIQGEMAALEEHKRFLTTSATSCPSSLASALPPSSVPCPPPASSHTASSARPPAPAPTTNGVKSRSTAPHPPSGKAAGATVSLHATVSLIEVPETKEEKKEKRDEKREKREEKREKKEKKEEKKRGGRVSREELIAEAALLDERCRREAVRAALRTESDLAPAIEARLLNLSEKQFTKFVDSLVICRSTQDPCPHTCGRKKCKPSGKRRGKKGGARVSASRSEMAAVFEKEEVLTLKLDDQEDEIVDIVDC
eukprot:TRINITY_DN8874_c0_g1_i3.p1 TRINITY_DN8874_c0_g1~~TRINITY_DN8874_c0_g1_i3.p1  ORF type:complete len:384 (-),score=134.77 TRINITY_DN8874_c0_g1_i3:55-1206(-)